MIRKLLGAVALALGALPAWAERQDVKAYVFGNSLVHHLSETDDNTNVPHWLGQMARADGRTLGLDGQWGFLRNFADGLPPTANWSFPNVRGVWGPGQSGFGSAGFDSVIVTPANFIQYQLPNVPYDGDNPTGESPLGAALRLFDWVDDAAPDARLFVYEGWAAMDGITGPFPPDAEGLGRYHAHNAGDYHLWYEDFLADLAEARPALEVTLIPVASVLAGLLADGGVLEGLPAEALYVDDAPHGTPTQYLLAAMVTYAALYEAPPPADYQPPASLHPDVVAKFPEIAQAIWDAMPEVKALKAAVANGAEAVAEEVAEAAQPDLPQRQPIALPPRGIRPDGLPALAMGLNGISDWSTQHPFLDLFKSSRPWVGHLPGQWGGVTTEELEAGGHLSPEGWPLSLPEGVEALEAVLLTEQPEGATSLRGDYVLRYEGTGRIRLEGRAKRTRYDDGRITFFYEPGGDEGLVAVKITELDPSDPIRNITIVREDMLPLYDGGAIFNPDWIEAVADLRALRFMDWMLTNGSPIATWEDRPRMTDATWVRWGVPVEVMIRLANKIGADPWFNMPHMADDAYIRAFAEAVEAGLDPRLKAYVEYSNEVWNRIFPQATWAEAQADALWGHSETGWMQFYGMRAAQVMDIWTEVFDEDDRLVRVVATHTGWPGLEEQILVSPLGYLKLGKMAKESFDAYAVTGYFGYEMGGEEMAQRMNDWLDQSEALATAAGEAQGLRRVALREFVKTAQFEAAIAPVALALAEGSLRQLVDEVFPYHAGIARKHGLRLVMYEGGTHVSGHGPRVDDDRLTAFFTAFNYTPEMAKLYEILLAGWEAAGGTLFNAFVDVAPASKWGSWGAKRYLEDQNPRWDMLMAYNAAGPNDWETRDPAAFANGITRVAGVGNQRLQGTSAEDVLVGGSGNDTLVSAGGADVLAGGPGVDRAVLPGAREDYAFDTVEGRLLATGPDGGVILSDIEEVVFDDAPSVAVAVADL
ncbi:calcium-binding protein [Tropicibacter alexandrii]|uniref:calcium-binding protein n=1 Tax=Tropicibacter alexandrii TaxID=2267683 RepID=UPI000EF493FD|nr:calcium-binding protein [Tropicibacter alexandrii]